MQKKNSVFRWSWELLQEGVIVDFFSLGVDELTVEKLVELGSQPRPALKLPPQILARLAKTRDSVSKIADGDKSVYGVNTGFGFLANVKIKKSDLKTLQKNIVRSHAAGVGELLAPEMVRALMVLRLHSFAMGYSGISVECMSVLIRMLDADILPLIPTQGSVGASGDLAPLAHLALALIGEGQVLYQQRECSAAEALKKEGIAPLDLKAKEGLSLINGTHFMTVLGAFALMEAETLVVAADVSAAMSLTAIRGTPVAYDPRIQHVRPHRGQMQVAANLLRLLKGEDEIRESHKGCNRVQDPYSFRCVPQVHGASRDVLEHVRATFATELNSVTDNPLVFADDEILSGGNFHGQPLSMGLDFLSIAVAELGSIAERRIEKLTNPEFSGLPAFLARDSGLNSGFMIPHVVSASLVAENRVLCAPASTDSIPTSADKEDHVSMGPIAGQKCLKICRNLSRILSIELIAAAQGIDLLSPLVPAPAIDALYKRVREVVPYSESDQSMHPYIEKLGDLILQGAFKTI